MARVTELYVRADWALVRTALLPILFVGLALTRIWPVLAVISLRVAPCGLCLLVSRWGNHLEEWLGGKPLLRIAADGLEHEDGGETEYIQWSDVLGVALCRRNPIPPWRTDGSLEMAPPFWLSIAVRDHSDRPAEPETAERGYVVPYDVDDDAVTPQEPTRVLCFWPRQVRGGLWSLVRFARELQANLIAASERKEIPNLLPAEEVVPNPRISQF